MHLRLALARSAGRLLPPVGADIVASWAYPWQLAGREHLDFRRQGVSGARFHGNMADEHAYYFSLVGYYDWKMCTIARVVCRPGDTVVEVGANIGTETVSLARLICPGGRVIAFEPLPANLALLRANTAQFDAHVQVVPAAVGDAAGTMVFLPPEDMRHSGVGHLRAGAEASDGISVDVTTLDEFFPDYAPARLLVIDVEGAEVRVLRGGARWLRRALPVIVVEACAQHLERAGSSRDELLNTLKDSGYIVRAIGRLGLGRPATEAAARAGNWLAVPAGEEVLLAPIERAIRRAGILPPWPGLNHPLVG